MLKRGPEVSNRARIASTRVPQRHRAARASSLGIGTDEQADSGDAGRAVVAIAGTTVDGHPANRQDRHPDSLDDARQAFHTEQHVAGFDAVANIVPAIR